MFGMEADSAAASNVPCSDIAHYFMAVHFYFKSNDTCSVYRAERGRGKVAPTQHLEVAASKGISNTTLTCWRPLVRSKGIVQKRVAKCILREIYWDDVVVNCLEWCWCWCWQPVHKQNCINVHFGNARLVEHAYKPTVICLDEEATTATTTVSQCVSIIYNSFLLVVFRSACLGRKDRYEKSK